MGNLCYCLNCFNCFTCGCPRSTIENPLLIYDTSHNLVRISDIIDNNTVEWFNDYNTTISNANKLRKKYRNDIV